MWFESVHLHDKKTTPLVRAHEIAGSLPPAGRLQRSGGLPDEFMNHRQRECKKTAFGRHTGTTLCAFGKSQRWTRRRIGLKRRS